MNSDWNVRRKARGRIRRARLRRRRQRMAAAGLFAMFCLAIFAFGAVDYGAKRHVDRQIAKQPRITFALPQYAPLIAQAGSTQPDSLPDLLPIKEQFPDYRDVPRPKKPDAGNDGAEDDELENAAETNMVILDDLRAAPPKSMFVNAIFENAESDLQIEESIVFLSDDFTDPYTELFGRPHEDIMNNPPIPEPSTALLLSLGLTAIAGWRRHEAVGRRRREAVGWRRRRAKRIATRSSTRSASAEGHET